MNSTPDLLTLEDKFSMAKFSTMVDSISLEEARELLSELYKSYLLQGRAYQSFIESGGLPAGLGGDGIY